MKKKNNNNDKQQYEESSSDLENDFDDNEEYEPSNRQEDKLSVNAESDTSTCENKSKKPVKKAKKKVALNSKKTVVIFNVAGFKFYHGIHSYAFIINNIILKGKILQKFNNL